MPKSKLEMLGRLANERREEMGVGVRVAAKEIGISHATLSRIERGNVPDIETFSKLCDWLKLDPSDFLGHYSKLPSGLSVHFRKNQSNTQETSKALADLIMAADEAFFS